MWTSFHWFPQITCVLVFQYERRLAWCLQREKICTFDRWVLLMSDFRPSPSPFAPRYFSHLLLHPSPPLCALLFLASSLSWWSGTCMCSGVRYRLWRCNISGLCISNIKKDVFYCSLLPPSSFSCLLSWVKQTVKEVFGHWCLILQISLRATSGIEIIIMEIISSIFNVCADTFTLKLCVMN